MRKIRLFSLILLVENGNVWYDGDMAYIRKIKNREGKEYIYLVETYRDGDKVRSRTLKSYGRLEELEKEEPGIYERLKKEAKEGKLTGRDEEELWVRYSTSHQARANDLVYGWKILDDIYEGLGISQFIHQNQPKKFEADLNHILKLLTFQRILDPTSKLGTVRSQHQLFGNWSISENAMYRSLKAFHALKDPLQRHIHHKITQTIGRQGVLVFYDVTNYYFEIDMNDLDSLDEEGNILEEGLRKRGASKEYRPKPIIQMGLFMDMNGIPISYKLFKGNQTDPTTYLPAIEQVKEQFGLERIIVVADKAMNSKKNITATLKMNDGWLFSQKHRGKRGAPKDIQSFLLDPAGWEFNESLTFAKKSMIRTRKLDQQQEVQEKVLVTWSKKYADREKIRREGALEYASKLTDAELFRQTAKKGGKKYLELKTLDSDTGELQPFAPFIAINTEEVDFDAQFDGMNVLVTSELEMSDEEMLASYRELSRIEDCFRVTKTEFNTRPVYVRKKEHIEAHFLTCFLSLVILRILQYKSERKMSPHRMIQALNSAQAAPLTHGYYAIKLSDDLRKLQQMLGIEWDQELAKHEVLNQYAKGWFTTSK